MLGRKKKIEEEEVKRIPYAADDFEDAEQEPGPVPMPTMPRARAPARARAPPVPVVPVAPVAFPDTYIKEQETVQTQPVIINQKTGERYDLFDSIVKILNLLEE